jgi:AAA domain
MSALLESPEAAAEFVATATLAALTKKKRAPSEPTFLVNRDDTWDEAKIPQRQWIALRYLMVGKVALLIGTPAAGKSLVALQWGISLALNLPLGDFKPIALPGQPSRPRNVLILNAEDDDDEQRRRISALIRPFNRKPSDMGGRLIRLSPKKVATLFCVNDDNEIIGAEGLDHIRAVVREEKIDVLILDPLAELMSGIDENDNGAIASVMAELRSLAIEENIAILVVHHTRKGTAPPGSLETARGASSLGGSVRVALTLAGMSEDEAKAAGVGPDTRKHYSRLDDAKQSYTAMSDAIWFEKTGILLENGDSAPLLSPWAPPKDVITTEIRAAVEAGVAQGINSEPWSPSFSPKYERSIGHLMIRCGVTTGKGQKDLLDDLLSSGFEKLKFKGKDRHQGTGLRSPAGEPSSVSWEGEKP